jgi:hypothetical protein
MAKDDVILIEDDGLDEIEKNILIDAFGKDRAEELLKEVGTDVQPLEDEELQEIVDSAPALDEI